MAIARSLLAGALGGALLLTSCIGTRPSRGEEGEVEVAWASGVLGCIFGCNADEPMVAGGRAYLMVTNDEELPAFTVESDTPSLMSATRADEESSTVILEASGSGRAKVVFRDAGSGEVFDRFLIYIHDVDRIELQDDELFRDAFTLMVGGDATIYFDLRDTKDHYLQGIGGLTYELSGAITEDQLTLVDAIAEALVDILAGSNNESVAIEALGVGEGAVVASAPSGASRTIPVRVVDAAAITRVEVFGESEPAKVGSPYSLNADAFAGDEEVRSPECAWSIVPADGDVELRPGRSTATLEAAAPTSATVTCTIGGVSGSLEVEFGA